MEIHVSLADDKTKVSFNVHNGVAREAVTGTLPRLRELFQQAGINLQHVDVTEHQSGSNQGGAGSQSGQAGTGGGQDQSGASIRIQSLPGLSARPLPDNMIDAYA
jgi:flagellar hook-length control protein FliK